MLRFVPLWVLAVVALISCGDEAGVPRVALSSRVHRPSIRSLSTACKAAGGRGAVSDEEGEDGHTASSVFGEASGAEPAARRAKARRRSSMNVCCSLGFGGSTDVSGGRAGLGGDEEESDGEADVAGCAGCSADVLVLSVAEFTGGFDGCVAAASDGPDKQLGCDVCVGAEE